MSLLILKPDCADIADVFRRDRHPRAETHYFIKGESYGIHSQKYNQNQPKLRLFGRYKRYRAPLPQQGNIQGILEQFHL